MDMQLPSIEAIKNTLNHLRQDKKTKIRYPSWVWKAIIGLLESHSINELANQLEISPAYLRRKARQLQGPESICFQEIITDFNPIDTVVIELEDKLGLKAKIQGRISCLTCLEKLFGRV